MRVKKSVILLFLISVILFPVYSNWEIGEIVDDFGDPTGDNFVYCLVDNGKMSNSATINETCKVRIMATLSSSVFPQIKFEFQIHDYNWNNPVNEFYTDSNSFLQFKDDKGKVIKFNCENSKYSTSWNKLYDENAFKFYEMLVNSDKIKAAISCENVKYNFIFDTEDFLKKIEEIIDKKEKVDKESSWNISISDSAYSDYQFASVSKYFKLTSNNKEYALSFSINGYPDDLEDTPSISLYLYNYCYNNLYLRDKSEIKGLKLFCGSSSLNIEDYPTPYPYFTIGRDVKKTQLNNLLAKGSNVRFEVEFKNNHNSITFNIKSSELKKYVNYPYPKDIINNLN